MLRRSGGSRHITVPNFLETGPSIAEILRFFDFPSWIILTILDFWIRKILLAARAQSADTHHHSKLRQNWSICCGDIAIFRIFKIAAAAILDFWNHEIVLANGVHRVETQQHAKFRQYLSIHCKDIKIFRFFKMMAAAIFDCRIRKILLADGVKNEGFPLTKSVAVSIGLRNCAGCDVFLTLSCF